MPKRRKPTHACSPAAALELEAHWHGTQWHWSLKGSKFNCGFCPWCGESLPHHAKLLEVVR